MEMAQEGEVVNIVVEENVVERVVASVEDEERTSEQGEGEVEILNSLKGCISILEGCTRRRMR